MTEEFEASMPIDEQMGYDERLRLLYVACTRAMDHLVVSLHREERRNPPKLSRNRTNAEVLLHGMGELVDELPDLSGEAEPLPVDPAALPTPPPDFATWEATRVAALAVASRPGAVAATALTDEGTPDWSPDPVLAAAAAADGAGAAAPVRRTGARSAPVPPAPGWARTATRGRSNPRSTRACRSDRATSTCRRG